MEIAIMCCLLVVIPSCIIPFILWSRNETEKENKKIQDRIEYLEEYMREVVKMVLTGIEECRKKQNTSEPKLAVEKKRRPKKKEKE